MIRRSKFFKEVLTPEDSETVLDKLQDVRMKVQTIKRGKDPYSSDTLYRINKSMSFLKFKYKEVIYHMLYDEKIDEFWWMDKMFTST